MEFGTGFSVLLCGCWGVWNRFQHVAMRLLWSLEQISVCCYAVAEVFGLVFRMLLCGCFGAWNRFQRVAMRLLRGLV